MQGKFGSKKVGRHACIYLHAVEADKVVQLVVLDNGQEEQEEDNEWHELAAVVQRGQRSCNNTPIFM